MKKRLLLITGSPGSGKTTVFLKTLQLLKTLGCIVGGMATREVRARGSRVGFEIRDLHSGRKGWLAHVNQRYGPRIGKYQVNLEDLNMIGVDAIASAVKDADLVAIDEIGPMELLSKRFREAVKRTIEGTKPMIATFHWKARDRLIETLRRREDAEIYRVTYENRANLHETIASKAAELLEKATRQ